jgi:hypothetical protein
LDDSREIGAPSIAVVVYINRWNLRLTATALESRDFSRKSRGSLDQRFCAWKSEIVQNIHQYESRTAGIGHVAMQILVVVADLIHPDKCGMRNAKHHGSAGFGLFREAKKTVILHLECAYLPAATHRPSGQILFHSREQRHNRQSIVRTRTYEGLSIASTIKV